MASGRIYLMDQASNLLPMEEAPYVSEALLQRILAQHPDLLGVDIRGRSRTLKIDYRTSRQIRKSAACL